MLSKFLDLNQRPSRRSAVIWQTAGGYAANAIIIVQGFVLIPLYISSFGTELYGFWLASGGMLAWLSMIDVGGAAITRQRCAHAYGNNEIQRMVDYFWHGAVIMAGIVLLFCLLLVLFIPWIPSLIQLDEQYREIIVNCLYLVGFGTALYLSELFFREFVNACQRTVLTSFGSIIGMIASLALILVGLLVFDWGLYALAFAAVLRPLVPLLANIVIVACLLKSAQFKVTWSKVVFRDYLVTTPAVLAGKASSIFTQQLPVVLLTRWAGPDVTVAYTVTMRTLEMAKHFINQPLSSLYNSSAHLFGDRSSTAAHKSKIFSNLAIGFTAVTTVAFSIYILLNEGFVSIWVSHDKYLGSGFTALAALAMMLQLRTMLYASLIGAHGAIRISCYMGTAQRIFTACLLFPLVYFYQAIGVVLALTLAPLLFQIPFHRVLKQHQPEVAQSLFALQWVWLPAGLLFLFVSRFTSWWVVDTWAAFLLRCLAIAPIPAALIYILVPGLRDQIQHFLLSILRKLRLLNPVH